MKNFFINYWKLSVLCCIMMATSVCNAQSLTGSGTESEPYLISTQSDLEIFANNVNNGISYDGKFIKLTDNIVCNYNEDIQWTPIGDDKYSFQGTFDGNGKTISGLYYDNSYDYVGLFGYNQGTIKNVGVVKSNFKGKQAVGGVCGYNDYGTIINCYNTGEVSGSDNISGVCGFTFHGTITNCYNTGKVSGSQFIGGVCGYNYGDITNCYNTGEVSGSQYISGVCGENFYGTITNCYNTGEVSGKTYIGGVCGWNCQGTIINCYYLPGTDNGNNAKTKEQFNNGCVAYLLSQGDNGGVWGQDLSNPNALPVLNGERVYKYGSTYTNEKITDFGENGFHEISDGVYAYQEPEIIDGVYQIANAGNLYWFAQYVNQGGENLKANAILANDIVVNTLEFKDGKIVTDGKNYRVWTPIGYFDSQNWKHYYYAGTFDGKGHTISGLYINEDNSNYIGLFSEIDENSTIKNVGVVDSYFKVIYEYGKYVGSIVGSSKGKIINCYSNSTIVAPKCNNVAGGICGYNNSSVQNCYFVGSIICNDNSEDDEYEFVGGICGWNDGGQFVKCYYLDGCCQYTNRCGSAMTIEQFNSGEVAYNFGGDWGQDLSTQNTFPVLNGKKVYKYDGSYTNEKITDFGENGFSKIRDGVYAYQEPEVIDGVYQIANAGNLYWFAEYVNDEHPTINAVLTDDIVVNKKVLNDDGTLNTGMTFMEWTPIGYSYYDWNASKNISMAYQGKFDGQGHIVRGLYLNNSNKDYVSLFGYNEGTIQNVGVVYSYFYGRYYVGGVCGCTDGGNIKNCFSSATVIGDDFVGGVCGNTQGNIENCYNIGSVSGDRYVGGVVGYDFSSGSLVKKCYTTGIIKENGIKINKVLGYAQWGDDPVNCYYLADTEDGKGGMTAEQFASGEVAYKLGDAFYQKIGEDTLPVLNSTHGKVYKTSPCTIAYSNNENTVLEHVFDENGFCTACGGYEPADKDADGVYQITNLGNLYWFAQYVNQGGDNLKANAILTDNIVVNTEVLVDGKLNSNITFREWTPIGNDFNPYKGTFNGNGKTISGLYFNNSDQQDCVGLFGYNEGTIKNVGVVDSYFKGNSFVGGVSGCNNIGNIENCYNTGVVSGNNRVSGVCGYNNYNGTITNCYNTGEISGSKSIGGVCGENFEGTITNCYNTGVVSGMKENVGGVCGYNNQYSSTIENCYNTGVVSGGEESKFIGGVCGYNDGTIIICYNTGVVSGGEKSQYIGGVSGYNEGDFTNCYNNIDFCENDDNDGIITNKNTFDFCNGSLFEGFSDEIWSAGSAKVENGKVIFTLPYFIDGYKPIIEGEFVVKVNSEKKYYFDIEFAKDDISKISIKVGNNTYYDNDNKSNLVLTDTDLKDGLISGTFYGVEFSASVNLTDYTYKTPIFTWNTETVPPTAKVSAECNENSKHNIDNADCEITKVEGTEKSPTCEKAGTVDYKATYKTLSDTKTVDVTPALGHKYGEPTFTWTEDKTSVEGVIVCENDKSHTLSGGSKEISTDTTNATCTEKGKIVYSATVEINGTKYTPKETVEIPALGHKIVVDSAKTATCTTTGLTEGKHCSVCDSVLVAQQTVAKIAHTVVVDSAKTATCTATGLTEGKHCSVCDSIFVAQQTLPALGHKVEIVAGVSPTCTATGLTEGSHCSVCGEVIKAQETIPALGHLFTNYIYNNDATTEADGTETAVCDHGCGATDIRTAEGTKLTGIAGETANAVAIYAHHNVIVVENAEADIYVYDVTGRCIEMRESCPSVEIAMQREGIYIVRTGDKTQRVFVAQN